jgi:hypothetical protein
MRLIEPGLQDLEVGVSFQRPAAGLGEGEHRAGGGGEKRRLIGRPLGEDEEQQSGHGRLL